MHTRRLLTMASFALALSAQTPAVRQPIARLGDQAIYDEDLQPFIGGQLLQLKNQEYALKTKALESLLRQRLVEKEAQSAGLTVEEFLAQTVDRNLPPWHADELGGFYLARREQFNKPLADVKQEVEKAFLEARRQQARQEYIDQLWQKAGVAILLNPPRIEVAMDPARTRGSPDAQVTVVEFADYQCPYCKSVEPVLAQLRDKYQGKVRFSFRDFPLKAIHPQAQSAAEASRCAEEQGKFWEYHDLLYANQSRLNPDTYGELARSAGLNGEQFAACLAGGKFRSQIESDLQSGVAAGVSGTPAFYINGVVLTGSQPLSAFEKVIDSQLLTTASLKPAGDR